MLDDEKERKKCIEVVEEARERVDKMVFEINYLLFYMLIYHVISKVWREA